MSEIVAEHTALADEEHQQLGLLVSEWQLLADLAFSDLVLWVPDRDPNGFWAAAQIRPTTGPTALADDVVGDLTAYAPEHLVSGLAYLSGEIAQTSGGGLRAVPASPRRSASSPARAAEIPGRTRSRGAGRCPRYVALGRVDLWAWGRVRASKGPPFEAISGCPADA